MIKREKVTKPQYFNVIAFGKTAELIGDTLNKGNKSILAATLSYGSTKKRTAQKVFGYKSCSVNLNTAKRKNSRKQKKSK